MRFLGSYIMQPTSALWGGGVQYTNRPILLLAK